MEPGQKIRDFVFEERIGAGGVGEVWRARHEQLDKTVAVKAIYRQFGDDEQVLNRFKQEAMAMAQLEHPHIVGVHDFFLENGVAYLVMSHIEGSSLQEMIELQGQLPPAHALRIARQILEALNYAHKKGVIHRDVKPSNILVSSEGNAYLVDFGIALVLGKQRITKFGTNVGTPDYMSPEQIRATPIDHRTDVYSFGCVLYEMLAGKPPFGGEDNESTTDFVLMEEHLTKTPTPLRTLNPEVGRTVEAVVARALAKEPERRYGGCLEMANALAPNENGGDASASGKAKPRRWLVAAVLVLGLTTGATTLGWIQALRSESGASATFLANLGAETATRSEQAQAALASADQARRDAEDELLAARNENRKLRGDITMLSEMLREAEDELSDLRGRTGSR